MDRGSDGDDVTTQIDRTESTASEAPWIAGADGFRDGWVVALWQPETGTWRWRTVDAFADLLHPPRNARGLRMEIWR